MKLEAWHNFHMCGCIILIGVLGNYGANIHIFHNKVKTSTGYSISNRPHRDNKETINKMKERKRRYEKDRDSYSNRRNLSVERM